VDNVQIYEERKENGQWLKSIEFKLPIIEKEFTLSLDNDTQNETVVLLSGKNKETVNFDIDVPSLGIRTSERATYAEIKKYIKDKHGLNVSSLYIAQVKEKYGVDMRENYNLPKSEDSKQPKCPEEKEQAILEALKHFGLVK